MGEITPKSVYMNRRRFLSAVAGLAVARAAFAARLTGAKSPYSTSAAASAVAKASVAADGGLKHYIYPIGGSRTKSRAVILRCVPRLRRTIPSAS